MNKKLIEDINNIKNIMRATLLKEQGDEYEELPKINDTYPNVDFHPRTKNDRLNPKILDDIQRAAKNAGITVTVNYTRTGHKKYTDNGGESRHYKGLAVDVSQVEGPGWSSKQDAMDKGIYDDIENFVSQLRNLGYNINKDESGNEKVVLYFGVDGHHDHIHVSNTSVETTTSTNKKELVTKKIKDSGTKKELINKNFKGNQSDKKEVKNNSDFSGSKTDKEKEEKLDPMQKLLKKAQDFKEKGVEIDFTKGLKDAVEKLKL